MDTVEMVYVERENEVESIHRGMLAVVDYTGKTLTHAGNAENYIFARSTIKPIIALPLIVDGVAEKRQLTAEELAVACSSHSGQQEHVDAVRSILHKAGLGEQHLQCGVHDPWHKETRVQLRKREIASTSLHNNCSGKHAAMLAWCNDAEVSLHGYMDASHPVQKRVKSAVSVISGLEEHALKTGIDGCGVPVFYMPLQKLAYTMARFGKPDELPQEWQLACRQMTLALQRYPFYLAGEGRFEYELMQATNSRLIGKSGAEGVFVVSCPEEGWGLAVKMADGADRGVFPAVMEALIQMDSLTSKEIEHLSHYRRYDLHNWAGTAVGEVYASFILKK